MCDAWLSTRNFAAVAGLAARVGRVAINLIVTIESKLQR
jgi:hypothetical protein